MLKIRQQEASLKNLKQEFARREREPRITYAFASQTDGQRAATMAFSGTRMVAEQGDSGTNRSSDFTQTENPVARENESPEERARFVAARFDSVQNQFYEQIVDESWAARITPELETALAQKVVDVQRSNVECRKSWCSVEFPDVRGVQSKRLMQGISRARLALSESASLMMYSKPSDTGGNVVRYYFRFDRR